MNAINHRLALVALGIGVALLPVIPVDPVALRRLPSMRRSLTTAVPSPATLLLGGGDLPPGYQRDDLLENAEATARTDAYADLTVEAAFVGYRRARAALVQYVALLHSAAAARQELSAEDRAIAQTGGVARLTVAAHGDGATLAYSARNRRGQVWTTLLFSDGPYLCLIGAYDADDDGRALALAQTLASVVDARARLAATALPSPPPTAVAASTPSLRLSLQTTTAQGHATDLYRPHGTIYWRATWQWQSGHPGQSGAFEDLTEAVMDGGRALYRNTLYDRVADGMNELDDHLTLHGATPGRYQLTVTVTIGIVHAIATRTLYVH